LTNFSVAQILTPGLKQNLHHKRGFAVSQVHLESHFLKEKQAALVAIKHRSVVEETQDCSHYQNRAGSDRSGPVPSRQTFSLGGGDGTEMRRDGDVPLSVNISV
jgi:hypothetical protein